MKAKKKKTDRLKTPRVIEDYDVVDTSGMIDQSKLLRYEDLGLKLPEVAPTQVISIRLPSALLNELRAISSQADIPYQALIKLFLSDCVSKLKKRSIARS
jgi:hypothetical protein